MTLTSQDRLRGVAMGAAVGDALGMPLEFRPPHPPDRLVRQMLPGRLPAGSFTDDTEMAIALAEALLEQGKQLLDGEKLGVHFVDWYQHGPSDIGYQTASMLHLIAEGTPWEEAARRSRRDSPDSAGNGSVMRCWPVAVARWKKPPLLKGDSELQSLVTHPHPDCVAGSIFVNVVITELVKGTEIPAAIRVGLNGALFTHEARAMIEQAPDQPRSALKNTGWVAHTLQSAVWGLRTTSSFEEAVVQVANLGNDADTAASVTGALAGAAYGLSAIPADWRAALHGEWPLGSGVFWTEKELLELADKLMGL